MIIFLGQPKNSIEYHQDMNNKEMGEMWEFNTFVLDYSKRLLSKLIPTFVVTLEQ